MNPDIEFEIQIAVAAIECHRDVSDYQECAYWEGYIEGLRTAESILNEKEKNSEQKL